MNDATLEMIAAAKAARQAKEEYAEAKRRRKEESKRRIEEYARQRPHRTKERIQRENRIKVVESDATVGHMRRLLTEEKLNQIGDSIPGSNLVRDFCTSCGEAMRVVRVGVANICLECKPSGCPGTVSSAVVVNTIVYHGGRFHSAEW